MTQLPPHFSASDQQGDDIRPLRRGWTTGACATGAVMGAVHGLLHQECLSEIQIQLPHNTPTFSLIDVYFDKFFATASVIKDAGDDPDVTHGAKITAKISRNQTGIIFKAGEGVGTVTKEGLPLAVGEPAINPKPREIITNNLVSVTGTDKWTVEISIENGAVIALDTWNPRLGIVGGLSVLGTTGVVIPFSCSAWIHSIHRGIDVALAEGLTHMVGSTGKTSERVAMETLKLSESAYLDMGDFAGGMLKYLSKNPVPLVTISGGFAKMVKLAQGNRDLHSSRSQVDFEKLSETVAVLGGNAEQISLTKNANTALEVLQKIHNRDEGLDLVKAIAHSAKNTANSIVGSGVIIKILMSDREGNILYKDT